ncbi:nucleic-acid-binding protein from transposon X-element [Trichonephila clavipes]|nr:nucleic-acid-binding protein from transposon X-element [Trichonephila clavipes]
METDQTPPNAEDLKTCSRILDVFEYQLIKKTRLTYNQHILSTMDNGLIGKNQESYDLIEKENEKLMEEIQDLEADERKEIINFLKETGEQFFALHPQDNKPQEIVIKGLPISTDIDDIKKDLSERGFLVNKVAQLTKLKSKFKLPIFMVELQKSPDSPDIFKLDKCCYLTVKIDTFNRRPGPTQCYTCNLFNHSSKNCHIKTRCLKCGEPHRTDDCPIRNLIENPVCINCKETGHLANSHRCAKFPKIQPKKGKLDRFFKALIGGKDIHRRDGVNCHRLSNSLASDAIYCVSNGTVKPSQST